MELIVTIMLAIIGCLIINALRSFTELRSSVILSLIITGLFFLLNFEISTSMIITTFVYFLIIFVSSFIGFKVANIIDSDSKIGYYIIFGIGGGIPYAIFYYASVLFLNQFK